MSKFLFVVPPFFGHISPTLSVGGSLIERGHEVVWVGLTPIPDMHIPEGGRFIVPPELEEHREAIGRILKRQDDGPYISGAEAYKLGMEETYIPFSRFIREGLDRVVDAYQPDVLVNDCLMFAGTLCAHRRGILNATTTPVPPDLGVDFVKAPKIFAWQRDLILGLQQEFGIHTDAFHIHSDRINLVFTSRVFAGRDDLPAHLKFVGPVQGRPQPASFDWARLAETPRPRIFVSLGTLLVDIRRAFFEKLRAAFADEPLTVVAATDPGIFDAWPDNFIVQGFVPQSRLLQEMDAVICHGGFNTVNDTFLHGLPMVITPIAYDHFHTASLIEKAGCGIKIRYKRLTAEGLREATWEVLKEDRYRANARRIRETFIGSGGNAAAVEHLEAFAWSGKVLAE
ncbi:glycosyltransferase [Dinghuibacter silviterrae]|uniref:MGT family glycosyltransferase n=1 Tax=Dinghuibacter silviterrae TaxID=1539049 RepID=A0A4R8DMQ0_9BACT|nr:nucleotide disphospho-sugar-binding domain-containing protein [Dinghuibacter silviterrae]TDW99253.1 MGT family glycosyltransferase [Dinghuibacter silviterrae]